MRACPSCGREIEDDFVFCPHCGAERASAAGREQRKTVTVLFCDLTGSTSLGESTDPEALRRLLARYFERMKGVVEAHGGSVEKFIGDAVMAVFGVPVAHEDDALRAVRAAAEMREALPELGLQARIGLNTGEVVTGTAERLATGDAVNVAARLEQAALPGEVLIGAGTLALVDDAVDVEELEPLELKGKAAPVGAFRLVHVRGTLERRHDTPFVGREPELAALHGVWHRVQAEQRCELVTVVGDAGVGKSRLVAEFLDGVTITVMRGRCLPYGDGITYWPVVEVLKQLGVRPPDEAAAAAIRSLLGESRATTSADEIAWAFRKTLEHAAAQAPLVVVFDDIQWGEDTFRDLIEHVALFSGGAPILVLCMARPELTERRPAWPVTLRLEPLRAESVDELIPEQLSPDLRAKIAAAAGGNPLFIHEMLAMADEAEGEVVVPPTLRALLAERLDQLHEDERSVLERGSIEGEIFHRGTVQALASGENHVTPLLAALVRKQLIGPERPLLAGDDGFRFRHLLIRDAAYEALPKATRAELHERFASWIEQSGNELVELDELVGHHLERATGYRDELGMPRNDELAAAARGRLTAGALRAARRQDYGAAVSLFERAASLVPPAEIDLVLEIELADALIWTGRAERARLRADALAERASADGDQVGELCARLLGGMARTGLQEEGAKQRLTTLVEQAMPALQVSGNDLALYLAYDALTWVTADDAALEAYERALAHARQAGYEPPAALGSLAATRFFGSTTASEMLEWLDMHEEAAGRDHFLRVYRAGSLARLGRFDEARSILAESRAELAERGGGNLLANITAVESVWVELWAGDPAAAAEFAAQGWRLYEALGDDYLNPLSAGYRAQALYALDQLDEADAWAGRAAELGDSDEEWKEMLWRQVQAKVLARRGDHAAAERLAREAVALGDAAGNVDTHGDAFADLAEVLLLAGRTDDAVEALEQALDCFERKGNVVMAGRMRDRLAALATKGHTNA